MNATRMENRKKTTTTKKKKEENMQILRCIALWNMKQNGKGSVFLIIMYAQARHLTLHSRFCFCSSFQKRKLFRMRLRVRECIEKANCETDSEHCGAFNNATTLIQLFYHCCLCCAVVVRIMLQVSVGGWLVTTK